MTRTQQNFYQQQEEQHVQACCCSNINNNNNNNNNKQEQQENNSTTTTIENINNNNNNENHNKVNPPQPPPNGRRRSFKLEQQLRIDTSNNNNNINNNTPTISPTLTNPSITISSSTTSHHHLHLGGLHDHCNSPPLTTTKLRSFLQTQKSRLPTPRSNDVTPLHTPTSSSSSSSTNTSPNTNTCHEKNDRKKKLLKTISCSTLHQGLMFWFGREDADHVSSIMSQYTRLLALNDHRAPNSREPKKYIGKVKRLCINNEGQLRKLEQILTKQEEQSLSLSLSLPLAIGEDENFDEENLEEENLNNDDDSDDSEGEPPILNLAVQMMTSQLVVQQIVAQCNMVMDRDDDENGEMSNFSSNLEQAKETQRETSENRVLLFTLDEISIFKHGLLPYGSHIHCTSRVYCVSAWTSDGIPSDVHCLNESQVDELLLAKNNKKQQQQREQQGCDDCEQQRSKFHFSPVSSSSSSSSSLLLLSFDQNNDCGGGGGGDGGSGIGTRRRGEGERVDDGEEEYLKFSSIPKPMKALLNDDQQQQLSMTSMTPTRRSHCPGVSYLFCLPLFNQLDKFAFFSGKRNQQVTFADAQCQFLANCSCPKTMDMFNVKQRNSVYHACRKYLVSDLVGSSEDDNDGDNHPHHIIENGKNGNVMINGSGSSSASSSGNEHEKSYSQHESMEMDKHLIDILSPNPISPFDFGTFPNNFCHCAQEEEEDEEEDDSDSDEDDDEDDFHCKRTWMSKTGRGNHNVKDGEGTGENGERDESTDDDDDDELDNDENDDNDEECDDDDNDEDSDESDYDSDCDSEDDSDGSEEDEEQDDDSNKNKNAHFFKLRM